MALTLHKKDGENLTSIKTIMKLWKTNVLMENEMNYALGKFFQAHERFEDPEKLKQNYASNLKEQLKQLPRIPDRGIYTKKAQLNRIAFIRSKTKQKLKDIEFTRLDPTKLIGNIENFIGSVEIPIGLAGPILVNGKHAKGLYYAPIATTEGALVASITRGARAITLSGGTNARVLHQKMTRAPVFMFFNFDAAMGFIEWVKTHFGEIQRKASQYSDYAILNDIEPLIVGRKVHLQFIYETGDAAGQNMTTHCTNETCLWMVEQIEKKTHISIEEFWIDGNMSTDKKASFNTFLRGRGIKVQAECFFPNNILLSVLRVRPDKLHKLYKEVLYSSIQAGVLGMNVNVSNLISAIFAATGQDIACAHESSCAQLHMDLNDKGIYACMVLSSLIIGTTGGGTGLCGGQSDCLKMMDCFGEGKVRKLAEIIASFGLALDLSTIAAVASHQFAYAHERLGKNRPEIHITLDDINIHFVTSILQKSLANKNVLVKEIKPIDAEIGSSIITQLASDKTEKLLGHYIYKIKYTQDEEQKIISTLFKIKPTDQEILKTLNFVAGNCSSELGSEWKRIAKQTEFSQCHIKELEIYKQTDTRFTRFVPQIYGIYKNDKREAFVIILEYLENMTLMDSADDVSQWQEKHIKSAIDGISSIHSIWYEKEEQLKKMDWIGSYPTLSLRTQHIGFWTLLVNNARDEFPEWFDTEVCDKIRKIIHAIPSWWKTLESLPKTLVHNDFNPRNLAFRKKELRVCIYDWELATIHLPQRDVAELLAFVLDECTTLEEICNYVHYHRESLESHLNRKLNTKAWWQGFQLCVWDYYINRFLMYIMGHTVRDYKFLNRVVPAFIRIVNLVSP